MNRTLLILGIILAWCIPTIVYAQGDADYASVKAIHPR